MLKLFSILSNMFNTFTLLNKDFVLVDLHERCRVRCVCILPPTCFTYNTIPIYLPTYFSLGTFHQDLTPIDLHEVRLEVCIQNSKTFICMQHNGTRESPKLSCARNTAALASQKSQKLFICTQNTGTCESLHERMAGKPKTSEA